MCFDLKTDIDAMLDEGSLLNETIPVLEFFVFLSIPNLAANSAASPVVTQLGGLNVFFYFFSEVLKFWPPVLAPNLA